MLTHRRPGNQAILRGALVILLGLVMLRAATAHSQEAPPTWQPLGGPPGRISHLAARADGSALYAVSVALTYRQDDQTQTQATGKAARSDAIYWSRLARSGATWQPLTNDLPPAPITALYADPNVEGLLWAGLAGGLWAGTPAGGWRRVPLDRAGLAGLAIRRITRGGDGRDLFFAANTTDPAPASYVYRSRDDGRTWSSSEPFAGQVPPPAGAPPGTAGYTIEDLIPAPDDPQRLFLTTRNGRLYHSADAGVTWRALEPGAGEAARLPAGEHATAGRLAFNADRPQTLLFVRAFPQAGTRVERSEDGGANWRSLDAGDGSNRLPALADIGALVGLRGGVFLLSSERGVYRSADGGATWQALEGALSSGGVAEFLAWPAPAARDGAAVFAATGYGVFSSWDGGALWQPHSAGLPFNSRIAGLLTNPDGATRQPGPIWTLTDTSPLAETAPPPLVLRSLDGGRTWLPAARSGTAAHVLSAGGATGSALAWAADPAAPDTGVLIVTRAHFLRTQDAGLNWQVTPLDPNWAAGNRPAIAIAPSNPRIITLGGLPALRSADRGETWQPMPVVRSKSDAEPARQASPVTGLAVDPANADHLWAGLDAEQGVAESTDGGRTWQGAGLDGKTVRWLVLSRPGASQEDERLFLYAGVAGEGIYRLALPAGRWEAASKGLPAGSTILSLLARAGPDATRPGLLWATRDGGGVYHSADGGTTWANIAAGLGDNLAQTAALGRFKPEGAAEAALQNGDTPVLLIGTANAGIWAQQPAVMPAAPPAALDARIELVWPHGGAAVTEAKRANIGFRLFGRGSLEPPPCGWSPRVTLWQAFNNSPAEPLAEANQRTVDGQPFPFWELNDVDVSRANDAGNKIYFLVATGAQGSGPDLATSVWAHGADPRTFFPQQDVPSGLAAGPIEAVDARIQIVWPHDGTGAEQPPNAATHANVAVLFFKRGTRLSAPVGWQPGGVTLYGAWNHEIGRPLAKEATTGVRTTGAITYPYWEFTNIPVARALDPSNRLYLWVRLDAIETHPTIWVHGTDARTAFPVPDEPIRGCIP
jgi:photosystem II stability/assembly factor-like uncharacterized protein